MSCNSVTAMPLRIGCVAHFFGDLRLLTATVEREMWPLKDLVVIEENAINHLPHTGSTEFFLSCEREKIQCLISPLPSRSGDRL